MPATLFLDGKTYILDPTFDALCRVEKALNMSLTQITVKLANGTLPLESLAMIVIECLRPPMPETFVRRELLNHGFSNATMALANMLSMLFGDVDAEQSSENVVTRRDLENMCVQFPD